MPEVVRNEVTGFIVPPNNSEALRDRIQYLIDNPQDAHRMGAKGREWISKEFTWDAVAGRCLQAYSEMGSGEVGLKE
jgi:phosphatidylinositol alpha-1,6-mannosyltransferase